MPSLSMRTHRGGAPWLLAGVVLLAALMAGSGCVHPMEIRRYGDWALLTPAEADWPAVMPEVPVRIGEMQAGSAFFAREILDGLETGLQGSGYGFGSSDSDAVEVDVFVHTDLSGTGLNYAIAFPGFLIFAPRWAGFRYYWMYEFRVVYRIEGREPVVVEFSVGYELRHCSFGRGFATIGAGWLLTWLSPLVAGFFYIGYNDGYTGYLLQRARPEVPDVIYYATQRIFSELNRLVVPPE